MFNNKSDTYFKRFDDFNRTLVFLAQKGDSCTILKRYSYASSSSISLLRKNANQKFNDRIGH